MPFFRALPPEAGVRHILQLNKPVGRALIALHEALMRSDSPLTAAQHEQIAAYVSSLNADARAHAPYAGRRRCGVRRRLERARAARRRAHHVPFQLHERLLEGHGVEGNAELFAQRGKALREQGYAPLLRFLD